MIRPRCTWKPWVFVVLATLAFAVAGGCNGGEHSLETRPVGSSIVVFDWPAEFGMPQRPIAEFDHKKHTQALEQEGCQACHAVGKEQQILPALKNRPDKPDEDELTDFFHETCIVCHKNRAAESLKTGPSDCGTCHVEQARGVPQGAGIRLDYSLHARHVIAEKEKCETCHHVFNEKEKKLEYKKGEESACRDCHGEKDVEKNLSLRNASHFECINCHLTRAKQAPVADQKIGPVHCSGCHEVAEQEKHKRLDKPPRLKRKQPDMAWVKAPPPATSKRVAFDHAFHETVTHACSDCHHKTLKPCSKCHPVEGRPEGGGVNLAQAFHSATSSYACVGCHAKKTAQAECASCHHMLGQAPTKSSCEKCHNGPPAKLKIETPPEPSPTMVWKEVPPASDDFPEEAVLKSLAKKYQPSKLPHRKIVIKLEESIRKSKLAMRFHGEIAAGCAGCHHHSPIGTRPSTCRSCHTDTPHPSRDLPDLLVALHRQCIGCHQQIGLKKALGCQDCHPKAPKEVAK